MNIDIDNPRIRVIKSRSPNQTCIVCDEFISPDGSPREILMVANKPGKARISFQKNLHICLECVDAFCEQLQYRKAHHDPETLLAYEPVQENA